MILAGRVSQPCWASTIAPQRMQCRRLRPCKRQEATFCSAAHLDVVVHVGGVGRQDQRLGLRRRQDLMSRCTEQREQAHQGCCCDKSPSFGLRSGCNMRPSSKALKCDEA